MRPFKIGDSVRYKDNPNSMLKGEIVQIYLDGVRVLWSDGYEGTTNSDVLELVSNPSQSHATDALKYTLPVGYDCPPEPPSESDEDDTPFKRPKNTTSCDCGVWTIADSTLEMHSDYCKLRGGR